MKSQMNNGFNDVLRESPLQIVHREIHKHQEEENELRFRLGMLQLQVTTSSSKIQYLKNNRDNVLRDQRAISSYKKLLYEWKTATTQRDCEQRKMCQLEQELRELRIIAQNMNQIEEERIRNTPPNQRVVCDFCRYDCIPRDFSMKNQRGQIIIQSQICFFYCLGCFQRCENCHGKQRCGCIQCHQGKKMCWNCYQKIKSIYGHCSLCKRKGPVQVFKL